MVKKLDAIKIYEIAESGNTETNLEMRDSYKDNSHCCKILLKKISLE